MIPQEWVAKYFEKSGDTKLAPTEYGHTCEQGFANWEINAEAIIIVQCFGDGKFWAEFFKDIGKQIGLPVRFLTRRNPKAWARKHGFKLVGYVMELE